jgi:hypothetical protein
MPILPQDAADALQDIEHAGLRSAVAYRYQRSSPHLFLWGVIWMVGYAACYARPSASWIWPPIVLIGVMGSFWINWRAVADRSRATLGWRYAATLVALFLFLSALFAILPPRSNAQIDAFFPLLIALWYAMLGIWTRAARIGWLGLALGALTVGGYFWLPQYFLLWMAAVGGGALILGGVWLRKV